MIDVTTSLKRSRAFGDIVALFKYNGNNRANISK
jgi:hypothetical protein